ncbi:IgA-specific serine endopeptidase autotransporter [Frankliniella fusca]|uniref:IgA-specific serine endopeptidase autotransporter n=1 Tax=Frankliniella fusca TaxID=407009 RepID=A0AAE1LH34_9NEOP|nr:IgA-specific serine endopeptidase autotransporter [Frankliniella fusca]
MAERHFQARSVTVVYTAALSVALSATRAVVPEAAYLNRRSTAQRSAARRPLWQRCAERLNTTLNRAPACSPHRRAQRLTTQT